MQTLTRTRGRTAILAILLTGQFMANVDTAVANIAAPSIGATLGASEGQVALVVSGYVVAFAVLLITGARLGSSWGYRRVFLLGLQVFTVASLACGLAPEVYSLTVARFVQGAGAALMVPQVLSGIQLYFAGRDRVKALGYFSIALSGGAVAGQVLGGLLIAADLFGTAWRPIFLINVPLGVALVLVARRRLPADADAEADGADSGADAGGQPRAIDLRGVLTLSVTVLLVIVPLLLGSERGWPWWSWLCLTCSVPLAVLFELGERRTAARGGRPLIARPLLRTPAVRAGLLAHALTTATYFGLLFVLALYLQEGLGKGPAYSGFAMVVWVAAFGLAGPILPRLPESFRWMPVIGCLILAAGYLAVLAYLLLGGMAGPLLFVLLGVGGLGLGFSSNTLIGAVTSATPTQYAADASGVIATNAQLSGALGVAVGGAVYAGIAGPVHALTVVLAGFAGLALAGAASARRLVR
ncbi:MFS transporter [Kribbella sp. NBC_00382]|uniref:MFS transporter n=1 Tax=Kribbella sp. NBC_00382 TaxID=2975967 RepID=UPI002E2307C2